jgi:hypothetical protein
MLTYFWKICEDLEPISNPKNKIKSIPQSQLAFIYIQEIMLEGSDLTLRSCYKN